MILGRVEIFSFLVVIQTHSGICGGAGRRCIMNIRIILFVLGKLAQACGLALMIPFVVALFYGESSLMAFLVAIVISLFLGRLFMGQGHRPTDSLTVREGVAITALAGS